MSGTAAEGIQPEPTPGVESSNPPARASASVQDEGLLRGRFAGGIHPALDAINRSLPYDIRLWPDDIAGSRAHARMLGAQGVLTEASVQAILGGLDQVAAELADGRFETSPDDEDVHMAVERRLTEIIGEDGKRLHAARSRNDQVATDLRLYLVRAATRMDAAVTAVQSALVELVQRDGEALLPFYTHLQRAQPVLLGHVLLSYVEMLEQDRVDLLRRPSECPLGAGAGTGTSFNIDRAMTARELGFVRPSPNSLEAVSSRRDATMAVAAMATCATTLSRLGADLVLWTSREFGFARLGDAVSTGSSIMPQKRNPDGAELLRAKAIRVSGALNTLLELQRGLSVGYHKDLQEDKPALFDAEDTLHEMLAVADAMLRDVSFDRDAMRAAVDDPCGFLLATEIADHLVQRGVPFREAHEATGQLVSEAEARGVGLEQLPDDVLAAAHPQLGPDVRDVLTADAAVAAREAVGGTSPRNVRAQCTGWRVKLAERVLD